MKRRTRGRSLYYAVLVGLLTTLAVGYGYAQQPGEAAFETLVLALDSASANGIAFPSIAAYADFGVVLVAESFGALRLEAGAGGATYSARYTFRGPQEP